MSNKLEILKKRLIYRASYRGTKEMDILLSNFVNKYIDEFDETLLIDLEIPVLIAFFLNLSIHELNSSSSAKEADEIDINNKI